MISDDMLVGNAVGPLPYGGRLVASDCLWRDYYATFSTA